MPGFKGFSVRLSYCGAGWPFFERGWRSVVTWNLNMFTLIAIGTGAAYLYSLVAVLLPGLIPDSFRHAGAVPVYFEAAAVIVTLVLLGQMLELASQAPHRGRDSRVAVAGPAHGPGRA